MGVDIMKKKAIDLTVEELLQIGEEKGWNKSSIWVSVNANGNQTIYISDTHHSIKFSYNELVEIKD